MTGISIIQPVSNAISLGYPYIEALLSVLPIANEVLINDGGSSDDTSYYLKKLKKIFPGKIRIFSKPYYPSDRWETIDETVEFLIGKSKGDWFFEVQADEICSEKSVFKLRQIIEKADKQGYNSIRMIRPWANFHHISSYPYRNVRMVRKIEGLKSYWGGDDFQINEYKGPAPGFTQSNVPPELVLDETCGFNLSGNIFPFNERKRVETIATFLARQDRDRQQIWQKIKTEPLPRSEEPNPEAVGQLPALVQGLAGLDSYRVREELFDKKWLTRLTGLNYLQL